MVATGPLTCYLLFGIGGPRRYFGAAKIRVRLGRLWDIDWHGALLLGASVGAGPGVEVVLFCAGAFDSVPFGFWFCLERTFSIDPIELRIERDESAGIRIGGWILSLGLIFGATVAGDWESPQGTLTDFIQYAWVSLLFMLAAFLVESIFKATRKKRTHPKGYPRDCRSYLLAAAIYVCEEVCMIAVPLRAGNSFAARRMA